MARRVSRKSHQQVLMQTWWIRAAIAVAFILLAYGYACLAIDSGSLLEYVVAIVLLWWAAKHGYRAVRFAIFS
jgi:hypothetical protein